MDDYDRRDQERQDEIMRLEQHYSGESMKQTDPNPNVAREGFYALAFVVLLITSPPLVWGLWSWGF